MVDVISQGRVTGTYRGEDRGRADAFDQEEIVEVVQLVLHGASELERVGRGCGAYSRGRSATADS